MNFGGGSNSEKLRAKRLLYGLVEANSLDSYKQENLAQNSCFHALQKYAGMAGISIAMLKTRICLISISIAAVIAFGIFFDLKAFLLIPVPLLIAFLQLQRKKINRAEAFEIDYPPFLLALASAVRAGLDPIVALCKAEELFQGTSLIKQELIDCRQKLESGIPEEEALSSFASSIGHPDIELFRTGFILSRKQGSSLSQCLQRLVKVTRQRQSFRRKIASAVAMQKLSVFGIALCALAIGIIQFTTNPMAFRQTLSHPFGVKAICFGGSLMISGISWMLYLTRRRI